MDLTQGQICGLMKVTTNSEDTARERAERMRDCPRLLASGTSSNVYYAVFILLHTKRWWLEYPAEHPEVLGAESISVQIIDNLVTPTSFKLKLPKQALELSPCGSDCSKCPMLDRFDCDGCPATAYYQQKTKQD